MKKFLGIFFAVLLTGVLCSCVSTSVSEKWRPISSIEEIYGTWMNNAPILGATNSTVLVASKSEFTETKIIDYSVLEDKELIVAIDEAIKKNISTGYKTKPGFEKWETTKKWQGVFSLGAYADSLLPYIRINESQTKLFLTNNKKMIYEKFAN